MTFNRYRYFILSAFVFLCAFFIQPSISKGEPQNESTVEKNKTEIMKDIELFEQSVHSTKSCVSEAKNADDLARCRNDETRIKFQRIQDDLSEIGMTPEERRMNRLRPER